MPVAILCIIMNESRIWHLQVIRRRALSHLKSQTVSKCQFVPFINLIAAKSM